MAETKKKLKTEIPASAAKKPPKKGEHTPAMTPSKGVAAKREGAETTKTRAKTTDTAIDTPKPKHPRRPKMQWSTHMNAEQARALRQWVHIDAKGLPLGRLCTVVATYLRGKHKPEYSTHLDVGDYVVITNAKDIYLTGDKWSQKTYYRHTGYMGHLRSKTAEVLQKQRPEELIRIAVKGMLPHTTLGRHMLKKLKVFSGETHPLQAQQPKTITLGVQKRQ